MPQDFEPDLKIFEEAHKGNFDFLKQAVEKDPSIITLHDPNERTVLHWAALSGNDGLVEFLLQKGCLLDEKDDVGMTPFILAASAGRTQVCRILVSKGASINMKNNQGHSALQYAASKGWNEIVQIILDLKGDVNIADNRGATPLHRAASKGMHSTLQLLVKADNLNINAKDSDGNTALHLACEEQRIPEAKLLVANKADLTLKNKEGVTPLDLADLELTEVLNSVSK